MEGMEIVFHCAAVVTDWAPKSLFQEVTVGGAENMCRAACETGVSRFVDISTCDVFGIIEDKVMDESFPLSPWNELYPDYKIQSEEIMWRYHKEKGLPVTMVYPLWVYGEGDQTFVPLLADAIVKKNLIFCAKTPLYGPPISTIWLTSCCSYQRTRVLWVMGTWYMTVNLRLCRNSAPKSRGHWVYRLSLRISLMASPMLRHGLWSSCGKCYGLNKGLF